MRGEVMRNVFTYEAFDLETRIYIIEGRKSQQPKRGANVKDEKQGLSNEATEDEYELTDEMLEGTSGGIRRHSFTRRKPRPVPGPEPDLDKDGGATGSW